MLTHLVVCLAVLAADDTKAETAPVAAPTYKAGSRVVVIHETPLRVDDRAVKQLPTGTQLVVEETQDGFLGVTAGRQGWIDEKDVVLKSKSLEPLTDLIAKDPDNVVLRSSRGEIAAGQKKWDLAIDDFNQLVRLEPDETSHYLARGTLWSEKHEWEKAMADFDEAVKRSDEPAQALMVRAEAWQEQAKPEKAIADLDEALAKDDQHDWSAEILRRRGVLHADAKEFDKAFADFKDALHYNWTDPSIFISRAGAEIAADKLNDAVTDYSAALYLDGQNVSALVGRADAFRRKQDFENARYNIDRALKIDSKSVYALDASAALNHDLGKYDKEQADYEEVLKLTPDDSLAQNNLAWSQATSPDDHARNAAAALEHAKKAVELSENKLPWIIDTLAAAYAEAGDFDKAVECQQRALDLTKDEKQRDDLRSRLELYQQRKPYHEKPAGEKPASEKSAG